MNTTRPAIQTCWPLISCQILRFLVTAGVICWEDPQFVYWRRTRY